MSLKCCPIFHLCLQGFPFDDDVMHGKSKLKDHLEDLAKRHPELADQLKDWADIERSSKIPRTFSGGQETAEGDQQQRVQQQQTTEGPSCPGPSKAPNLRATVPDMQAQQEKMDQQRNLRSQSAPPEGPPVKGQLAMHYGLSFSLDRAPEMVDFRLQRPYKYTWYLREVSFEEPAIEIFQGLYNS